MQVYIKETLYVLDYDNNIVDMIFTSDDNRTPGYAYNINITESNMGYSDLSFTMPTHIMEMPTDLNDAPGSEELIHNPKLDLLTPLVKLRYQREIFYTGQEIVYGVEPSGYGDAYEPVEVEYKPGQRIERYVMDYIVQPSTKKRNGHETTVQFNAIDYPRFNLSKKKFGATINENTVTRDVWSLYKSEPFSVPGSVQYTKWNNDLSNAYQGVNGDPIPLEWDPSSATSYPMSYVQIDNMMRTGDEKVWTYGLAATVFWWPITKTARFEGILYSEGDYLTLTIYPKFETGKVDVSEITHSLDFYGFEWGYLDKGDSYLTPNNPTNYLNWILETTNWTIEHHFDRYYNTYFATTDLPSNLEANKYVLVKTINKDDKYIKNITRLNDLPTGYDVDDLGKWCVFIQYNDAKTKVLNTEVYSWDGYKWYLNHRDRDLITTDVYCYRDTAWVKVTGEYWTSSIDKKTGAWYNVDAVETEIAKPDHSAGDLFEKTELIVNINVGESNCYNMITEVAKAFQLYPVFNCEERTVSLKLFSGKNHGLSYRLGHSLEGTGVKMDGDKVITKLYSFGGQDANGEENINLGEAERSYRKLFTGFYKTKYELPLETIEGEIAIVDPNLQEEYWLAGEDRAVYFYRNNEWVKGIQNDDGSWSDNNGILNIDPETGMSFPWDPNDPAYIQKRSPYMTNHIYNFKWMYQNGWITKYQILGLYELNQDIQDLNKSFLDAFTKDFEKTQDEYVDAGVNYSTNQDEYLAVLHSMMNTYYRHPGKSTEKFKAFPEKPADCYEENGRCYLKVYHCYECGATGTQFTNNKCTCGATVQEKILHINTWAEERATEGTSSEQWNPSSKGFFQQVYEQLGKGEENLNGYINIGIKFTEVNIDDLNDEKAYIINNIKVYDNSARLYHWNDCVKKWIEHYGYSLDNLEEVNRLQHKVELMDEAYKVYETDMEKIEDAIQDKYGDYIVEGKFHDQEIVYPAILLVKTLEASDQYATPEVTYTLNVIDSSGLIEYRTPTLDVYNELVHSLHGVGQIVPKAGDYVSIYDEPMGLYGVPGLITTIKRVLDNPHSNTITIDTSYTDNEELVGNIITATNTVLNNADIYARTAVLQGDGTISGAAMAKTLEASSSDNIAFVGIKGNSLLDSTGLLVTDPSNALRKMKYGGNGLYGSMDGGNTFDPMVTPEGINANYINAGSIDTQRIQIMSGVRGKVILDSFGLSIKDDETKKYTIPAKVQNEENDEDLFRDWSNSNLKAFIGVDRENKAQLYLNGQMQIASGSVIAGWHVLKDKITSGLSNKYVGISSDGNYAFWAGNQIAANAPFWVKPTGEAHFTNVLIDGSSSINGGNIQSGTVTNNQIAASTITADRIVDGTITAAELADKTITGIKIGDNVIAARHIVANTITSDQIATNTITATNIKSGAITADKIDATDLKVSAANITGTLTASQINTTGLKVAAANVTGTLTANQISGVKAASIEGKLTANQIDVDGVLTAGSATINGMISASSISASKITGGTLTLSSFEAYSTGTGKSIAYSKRASNGTVTNVVVSAWGSNTGYIALKPKRYGHLLIADYDSDGNEQLWKGITATVPIVVMGVTTKTLYFVNGIFTGYVE